MGHGHGCHGGLVLLCCIMILGKAISFVGAYLGLNSLLEGVGEWPLPTDRGRSLAWGKSGLDDRDENHSLGVLRTEQQMIGGIERIPGAGSLRVRLRQTTCSHEQGKQVRRVEVDLFGCCGRFIVLVLVPVRPDYEILSIGAREYTKSVRTSFRHLTVPAVDDAKFTMMTWRE